MVGFVLGAVARSKMPLAVSISRADASVMMVGGSSKWSSGGFAAGGSV